MNFAPVKSAFPENVAPVKSAELKLTSIKTTLPVKFAPLKLAQGV
ncbi:MAG: hypothetical protein OIN84_04285 [Candidatus Methanoperedens sp.]|nr:hypothetical protein [Candidatus Methanoperedens sp.]